jgi:hypothetical protein
MPPGRFGVESESETEIFRLDIFLLGHCNAVL